MYIGHGRLCVCVSVSLTLAAFPHYCMDPYVTWRNCRGCTLVVHCWAVVQSVHGFRSYDNITHSVEREISPSACTRSMAGLFIYTTHVQVRPIDGFSRMMAETMWTRSRMNLLGFR